MSDVTECEMCGAEASLDQALETLPEVVNAGHLAALFARLVGLLANAGALVPPVLLPKAVGVMLNVGERAVRKMMDRGELPWAWLGKQRVVPTQVWLSQLAEQAKANAQARCGR